MARKVLAMVIVGVAGLAFCSEGRAQYGMLPPVYAGPGSMFDQAPPMPDFGAWGAQQLQNYFAADAGARQTAHAVAAMGQPGEVIPFNMAQHQKNVAGIQGAFGGLMDSSRRRSEVQGNAATTFGNVMLGNWTYGNPGMGVPPTVMPYGPPTYTVPPTQLGQPFPAAVPGSYYPPTAGVPIYPTPTFGGF